VGALLGRAGTSDVVDGHVAVTAQSARATVVTSDESDLRRLSEQLPVPLAIRAI
jgi:hypothetical protein